MKMFDSIKQNNNVSNAKTKDIRVAVEKTEKVKKQTKKNENSKAKLKEQPKVGVKTLTKGNVAWRFGGHVCFGVLLASIGCTLQEY